MKLFHKGLLFLSSVFILQIGLFAGLTALLIRTEAEQQSAQKATLIATTLRDVSNRLQSANLTLVESAFVDNKEAARRRFEYVCTSVPADLKRIREIPLLAEEDRRSLVEISDRCEFIISNLRDCKAEVEREGGILRFARLKRVIDFEILPQFSDLDNAIKAMSGRHPELYAAVAEQHSKDLIMTVLLTIFVVTILAAVFLVMTFSRQITKRLNTIADNIHRLAAGKRLLEPIGGADEIGLVDDSFHSMARALSEATAKDKAVFASMPLAMITCNATGTIESVNPMAISMLDSTEEMLLGKDFTTLLDPVPSSFSEILRTSSQRPQRYVINAFDRRLFPVDLSLAQFRLQGDVRYVICAEDITEREYAEKLKAEMISVVSHDLRTPLTSIGMYLEALKAGVYGKLGESVTAGASKLHRECSRLMRLTKDLLDVAVLESGSVRLARAETPLGPILETCLDAVSGVAEDAGVELEASNADVVVYVDAERLTQILINFLGNAIKFSPGGSVVRVGARQDDAAITIFVKDEGRGIPKHLHKQIFERFKQARSQDARIGTGLGLAICKLLAEAHDGTVGVESEEGQGSTFWVKIPRVAELLPEHLEIVAGDA